MVDQEFDQIWQRLEAGTQGRHARRGRQEIRTRRRCGPTIGHCRPSRAAGPAAGGDRAGKRHHRDAGGDEPCHAAGGSRYPGQEAQMLEFFRKYPRTEDALRGPDLRGESGRFRAGAGEGDRARSVTRRCWRRIPGTGGRQRRGGRRQVALRRRVRARCQKALRQPKVPRRRRVPCRRRVLRQRVPRLRLMRRNLPRPSRNRRGNACMRSRETRRVTAGRIALSLVSPPCAGDGRTIARGTGDRQAHRKGNVAGHDENGTGPNSLRLGGQARMPPPIIRGGWIPARNQLFMMFLSLESVTMHDRDPVEIYATTWCRWWSSRPPGASGRSTSIPGC